MALFATLGQNAEYPASARVPPRPLSFSADGFDALLQIEPNEGPPVMERWVVNHMLNVLPKFMFKYGRCAEVEFSIELGGRE